MEWVILEIREFSFVEKPLVRKNTKLEPICQKTLQMYIDLVTVQVEEKLPTLYQATLEILWMDGRSKVQQIDLLHFIDKCDSEIAELLRNPSEELKIQDLIVDFTDIQSVMNLILISFAVCFCCKN